MKVLIAIKGCEAHRDRWQAQNKTWVHGTVPTAYLTGPLLGVPDDYASLPAKTKAICMWAKDLGGSAYDFCFLCDSDTYVSIPRLLASRFYLHDYVGHELELLGLKYASGGAGYWLSKKAMGIIAEHAKPEDFPCEDYMVGATLEEHGIKLHHDPRYTLAREKFVEPGNDIITKHLSMNGPYRVEMMYEAHNRALGTCAEVAHR